MQLSAPCRPANVSGRLRAAACLLLASASLGTRRASAEDAPSTQIDGSGLFYQEHGRTTVVEPTVRVAQRLPDGQLFSAQLILDAMSGASPTGATPSTKIQTTTSASGGTSTTEALQVPVNPFRDFRAAVDLGWERPLGLLTAVTGGHFSKERDYRSIGANERLSIDLMQRLTTLTVGAGYDGDQVTPIGGTPIGLSDGSTRIGGSNSKKVATGLVGISRVLSRRWLMGVTATRTSEHGYLTEPYKVVSLLDSVGTPGDVITENRPGSRQRSDVEASSAYHLQTDVLYSSYRYYWDDWGIQSHTLDFKYRRELADQAFVQPHVRLYAQTAADFFTSGLAAGAPRPAFASADYRLGPLRTVTLGATYGFRVPGRPGEFTIRAEYIHQWGKGGTRDRSSGEPSDDGGPSVTTSPAPPSVAPVDIGMVVVGWSFGL